MAEQSGILLSFDDYSPANWEEYFDLFDEYNVKVTFFINAEAPTDFCEKAVSRGHEIGFHTISHAKLSECTAEQFYAQAIAPIDTFREYGYELTSFAYPYGEYSGWMNEALLKHYETVRGGWYYQLCPKDALQSAFVEAKPIDNYYYASIEKFQGDITQMLTDASQNKGTVVSMYSHAIADGDWCVWPERLEYIFQMAESLNLKFYTYKDLQKH
ncbi:MAG: polysaccharide deacetylase family protein [Clostridium sp.]|jgi:peptidoglycan/xylan/chitin deacetylase (PgdA/CDA1 family)|nr:polysaccharide deacetylase family protein [Clostridium sp.]